MYLAELRAYKGILIGGLLTAALAVLVACAPAAPPSPTPAATVAPTATPAGPQLKVITDAKLGKILADPDGKVVYNYMKDERGKSTYTGTTFTVVTAKLGAGAGLKAALVGEASRPDGSKVITYGGWPLYYYSKDEKAGDTTGEAVGNSWF